jgi:hypothetical protein
MVIRADDSALSMPLVRRSIRIEELAGAICEALARKVFAATPTPRTLAR